MAMFSWITACQEVCLGAAKGNISEAPVAQLSSLLFFSSSGNEDFASSCSLERA